MKCSTATCTRKAEPGITVCRACLDRILRGWGERTGQAWVAGILRAWAR
jgi:hypothetical protein